MATQTGHSATAVAYAKSLLELANESNQAEAVNADLEAVREAMDSDPAFAQFFRNPSISDADRLVVLTKSLSGVDGSQLLTNFLGVLGAHGRLGILADVAGAYDELLGEQLGKIEVDVTVAHKLSPDELEQVRQKVSRALKKEVVIHQYVDESIVGGLILRVQDQLIDASVKFQLRAMREQMLAARPK